jgi:hypothetical protein
MGIRSFVSWHVGNWEANIQFPGMSRIFRYRLSTLVAEEITKFTGHDEFRIPYLFIDGNKPIPHSTRAPRKHPTTSDKQMERIGYTCFTLQKGKAE